MKSYCLKYKKDTENIIQEFQILAIVKQCYYQNLQNVEVKNQNSLKVGKQKQY